MPTEATQVSTKLAEQQAASKQKSCINMRYGADRAGLGLQPVVPRPTNLHRATMQGLQLA